MDNIIKRTFNLKTGVPNLTRELGRLEENETLQYIMPGESYELFVRRTEGTPGATGKSWFAVELWKNKNLMMKKEIYDGEPIDITFTIASTINFIYSLTQDFNDYTWVPKKVIRTKIGSGYTTPRGHSRAVIWLINGKAYAKDKKEAERMFEPLTGHLSGYVPVNYETGSLIHGFHHINGLVKIPHKNFDEEKYPPVPGETKETIEEI